ncbi:MAG: hypothetical protein AB7L09_24510 [Nitrospira sp.]
MFAARGHDRRSPPVESQGGGRMRTGTGPETTSRSSLITSQAWQSSFTGRGEKVRFRETEKPSPFAKMEESQRDGFHAVLSLTRLSASRRLPTRQMVAERGGMLNGPGEAEGNLSCNQRREIVEMRD